MKAGNGSGLPLLLRLEASLLAVRGVQVMPRSPPAASSPPVAVAEGESLPGLVPGGANDCLLEVADKYCVVFGRAPPVATEAIAADPGSPVTESWDMGDGGGRGGDGATYGLPFRMSTISWSLPAKSKAEWSSAPSPSKTESESILRL